MLNYCQNLSKRSSLFAIFGCFKISNISFLDLLFLMLHSFLQIKLKNTEQRSVLVRFKQRWHFIMEYRSYINITSLLDKQKTSIKSYTKDFIEAFATINIFPLINLEVTSMVVFPLITIDFMLLHSFSLKSIMVFIFLVLIVSFSFISISLASFLFFYFFSLFLRQSRASRSSLFLHFTDFILTDLYESSCYTFAICC